ncbi:ParA family protein [Flammeovirga agarivorans]|uniref:AAA family ATPase n=1 Tax=Flammeovirga agarivorans TaxID=2726742 RepID=A0A7X8SK42_9BACT|nr:ParA family protein [Flammeovirga agarivorans]NLR91598.1 AAA family ATPase [Flammeovirga agarivorans]
MNTEKVIHFIKQNKLLNVSELERQAKIPTNSLRKALSGTQGLKQQHVEELERLLTPLGYKNSTDVNIISVLNNKANSGKTTTTLNLGKALAMKGKKVLLIDADPQSALSEYAKNKVDVDFYHLIQHPSTEKDKIITPMGEHLDMITSSIQLDIANIEYGMGGLSGIYQIRNAFTHFSFLYDYILIDCPSSFNAISISAVLASTDLIIPVHPESYNTQGLSTMTKMITSVRDINTSLGNPHILFTGIKSSNSSHKSFLKHINDSLKSDFNVFDTIIHHTIGFEGTVTSKQNIFDYAPTSRGCKDFEQLASEIL